MIDVNQLEERLDRALEEDLRRHLGIDDPPPAATWGTAPAPAPAPPTPTPPASPARAPSVRPPATPRPRHRRRPRPYPVAPSLRLDEPPPPGDGGIESCARRVVDLVRLGRIDEADREIRAHAELAERLGDPLARRDAAGWTTMRALLDGRHQDARVASDAVLALGEAGGDPDAWVRHWSQRFWLLLDSGTDQEKSELLDLCRQRAYWHDELEWRAALTLLLARLGYADEAARELDSVLSRLDGVPRDAAWLDLMTNLAEAAAALGDPSQARPVYDRLAPFFRRTAVVGPALVCKGSVSYQLGLLAATLGRRADADRHFRDALVAHRQLGGGPLLVRTQEVSGQLASA